MVSGRLASYLLEFHAEVWTISAPPVALFFAASNTRPALSVTSATAARAPAIVNPCLRASSEAASMASFAKVATLSTC